MRKSSGLETAFDRDLTEISEVEAGVLAMAEDVDRVQNAIAYGRTVRVKVKFSDFRQVTRSRRYPAPVIEQAQLRQGEP
jgi:DNA polymerase-4